MYVLQKLLQDVGCRTYTARHSTMLAGLAGELLALATKMHPAIVIWEDYLAAVHWWGGPFGCNATETSMADEMLRVSYLGCEKTK